MVMRVLIIGAYGHFGRYISRALATNSKIKLILTGRSLAKAEALACQLNASNPIISTALDISKDFSNALTTLTPDLVIHTSGPFQGQDYTVAEACINHGCHYLDLADGREFVSGISCLHQRALNEGVAVISGASTVPCFTAALLDHYLSHFQSLEDAEYGIATAHALNPGLATMRAILSYAGKPIKSIKRGDEKWAFGWQGLYLRPLPGIGWRVFSHCDVPDLTLFPERYPSLKSLRFCASLEVPFLHLGLWLLSWLVRLGLVQSLSTFAPLMKSVSEWFNWLGSDRSGFYMTLRGVNCQGEPHKETFTLIAEKGDGLNIPCIPAILIATRLADGSLTVRGAQPCIGLISLHDYLSALSKFSISTNLQ